MAKFVKSWTALKNNRKGVTALEYGLIAAVVAIAMIAGASTLGSRLSSTFSNIATRLAS